MLKTMGTGARATFNAYISDCLTQENNNNSYSASKSRKRAFEAGVDGGYTIEIHIQNTINMPRLQGEMT